MSSSPAQLDYAPPARRSRLRRREVAAGIVVMVGAACYHWRADLGYAAERATFLYVQYRCLAYRAPPDRVVYEEDAARAAALVAADGAAYTQIGEAACSTSPQWSDFYARVGRHAKLWPGVGPGATVFLHELRGTDGRPLLVHVTFEPRAADLSGLRCLTAIAVEPGTWTAKPVYAAGLADQSLFLWDLPSKDQRVRLYAGRVDQADPSRARIPFEIDGCGRGEVTVQLVANPDVPGKSIFEFSTSPYPRVR